MGGACYHECGEENALFNWSLDGAVLEHFNVIWNLTARLDRDDVQVLHQRRLVLVNDRVPLTRGKVFEELSKRFGIIVRREGKNGDVGRAAPLQATQVFFGFLDLQTPIDVELIW